LYSLARGAQIQRFHDLNFGQISDHDVRGPHCEVAKLAEPLMRDNLPSERDRG
jgi:hypothetical protein